MTVTNNGPTFTPPANITVEATGPAGAIVTLFGDWHRPRRRRHSGGLRAGIRRDVPDRHDDGRLHGDRLGRSRSERILPHSRGRYHAAELRGLEPRDPCHRAPAGAVVPFAFTATDTVDGIVPVVCAPVGGSTFPIGVTPVTAPRPTRINNATQRTFTVTGINTAPTCEAQPSVSEISWPPNHRWVPVTITGGRDVDGDPVLLTIDSIFQDEPINGIADGDTAPDGEASAPTARVRAERAGSPKVPGNGRVYYINFTGNDGRGGLHGHGHGGCAARSITAAPHADRRRTVI